MCSARIVAIAPGWRNGRRGGLKSRCPPGHAGSIPAPGISSDGLSAANVGLARVQRSSEGDEMPKRGYGRGGVVLRMALLLGLFVLAACSDPVAVEHTTSSGNHTTSSGNSRQSRLQLPQSSADMGRRLDDAPRMR